MARALETDGTRRSGRQTAAGAAVGQGRAGPGGMKERESERGRGMRRSN